ncbi:hypothetical protein RT717_06820 [Imperialibacter roseus]|uniref:Uncharacterized protein n=1 Tax=Imperialibacter roseus TaxID=1324217 RepID=A0ABZ0IVF0_9BACT|nr:hypothetical protein [Imperialibacter roseus]WOK08349.1 hypothetical protein RT717_06820 [Imperialibacter roseus]
MSAVKQCPEIWQWDRGRHNIPGPGNKPDQKDRRKLNIGEYPSPTFYTFNDEVYEKALEEGVALV